MNREHIRSPRAGTPATDKERAAPRDFQPRLAAAVRVGYDRGTMPPAPVPPLPAGAALDSAVPPETGAKVWRGVVAAVAVGLAVASFAAQRRLEAARDEVGLASMPRAAAARGNEAGDGGTAAANPAGTAGAAEAALAPPENYGLEGYEHEPDGERLRLAAARGALVAEIGRGSELAALARRAAAVEKTDPAGYPAALRDADRARLASADRLRGAAMQARAVLAARPASWEATMVLGAATYLDGLERRDPRWVSQAYRWRQPLEAAMQLAPREPEPLRFLATAYLDLWPMLGAERREAARPVLRAALSDSIGFDALIDAWLAAAPDLPAAFALVPDEPFAWERLEQIYARHRDWDGLVAARRRWDGALYAAIGRDLAEAGRRLSAGDANGARALYLASAKRVRSDRRYAGLLAEALARCPPGPLDHALARRLMPQLAWLLDTCEFGGCAVEPALIARLARLAEAPPAWQARAALLAGQTDDLRRLERQGDLADFASGASPMPAGGATSPGGGGTADAAGAGGAPGGDPASADEWIPYLLAEAQRAAAAGHADEARAALGTLPPPARTGPLYWLASAAAANAAGDATAASHAAGEIARYAATRWPSDSWQWRQDKPRLVFDAAVAATGLTVEVPSAAGSVCEVRLDGALFGPFVTSPGSLVSLRPAGGQPLGPGPHLLEVLDVDIAGGRTDPGAVRLH